MSYQLCRELFKNDTLATIILLFSIMISISSNTASSADLEVLYKKQSKLSITQKDKTTIVETVQYYGRVNADVKLGERLGGSEKGEFLYNAVIVIKTQGDLAELFSKLGYKVPYIDFNSNIAVFLGSFSRECDKIVEVNGLTIKNGKPIGAVWTRQMDTKKIHKQLPFVLIVMPKSSF